ncbi:MAG: glycoside hydrolase family 99-like domain-containing protein [Alphaproteobacteria bacterium]|nr:glycoside hydrolase family 99-like domain-containing protein [Alphaproteobacteria bacterium]
MKRWFKVGASFLGVVLFLWFVGFVIFCQTVFGYADDDKAIGAFSQTDEKENENVFRAYQDYAKKENNDVRVIALYLPQFHQFEENNLWHGRGFTEWTNVTAAKPLFAGHGQPNLPIDVGFYDLTHPDIMKRQIELAQNYGVDGFAFYYYWFSGKKLMERPVYNYLNDKSLTLPFCLHWANENWSKRWDGGNSELLIEQKFKREDFSLLAKDLLPFFKDPRYIRVNGRPLFIVYRPALFDKELFKEFTAYLRQFGRENGVGEPYIMATKQFNFWDNPADWGLDAVMEFELLNIFGLREKKVVKTDDKANFRVFDWAEYINGGKMRRTYAYKTFRTVFPRWDNSARKSYSGALIFDGSTPDVYGKWLDYALEATREDFEGEERLLFINAWNEWGEGAMLEPDRHYGYAYLDKTREVLDGRYVRKPDTPPLGIAVLTGGRNRIAKGLELLNNGVGDRLLISGVRPGTNLGVIAAREDIILKDGQPIDLGYQATDTVGNALEIKDWVQKHKMNKLAVVTSFYHIPRSALELKHALGECEIVFYAANSPYVLRRWWTSWRSFWFLTAEYAKFLAVYLQYHILRL